eukprot:scaffold346_cov347-Pavlova_lutheri.AAC.56
MEFPSFFVHHISWFPTQKNTTFALEASIRNDRSKCSIEVARSPATIKAPSSSTSISSSHFMFSLKSTCRSDTTYRTPVLLPSIVPAPPASSTTSLFRHQRCALASFVLVLLWEPPRPSFASYLTPCLTDGSGASPAFRGLQRTVRLHGGERGRVILCGLRSWGRFRKEKVPRECGGRMPDAQRIGSVHIRGCETVVKDTRVRSYVIARPRSTVWTSGPAIQPMEPRNPQAHARCASRHPIVEACGCRSLRTVLSRWDKIKHVCPVDPTPERSLDFGPTRNLGPRESLFSGWGVSLGPKFLWGDKSRAFTWTSIEPGPRDGVGQGKFNTSFRRLKF